MFIGNYVFEDLTKKKVSGLADVISRMIFFYLSVCGLVICGIASTVNKLAISGLTEKLAGAQLFSYYVILLYIKVRFSNIYIK